MLNKFFGFKNIKKKYLNGPRFACGSIAQNAIMRLPADSSNNVNPFKSISFAFFQISNVQKNNEHSKQKNPICYPMQKAENICLKI